MDSEADAMRPSSAEPPNEDPSESSLAVSLSSSVLTDIEVDAEGRLDASNRDLTKLPKLQSDAPSVKKLVVAGNCLKSFDGIRRFAKCEEIDASDNKICSIAALLCVKGTLAALNVSRNDIVHCEQLSSFHALVKLDLSHNQIQKLPSLHSLPNLKYLDISSNLLTTLPAVHQIENLLELNLNSNHIETLENASRSLPASLQLLDVGGNKISDLTDVAYLTGLPHLASLTFEGNPAVATTGRSFCYRPYLCSCLPETLRTVDGFVLNDMEIVKGEWLCTQGRSRQYKPGTQCHVALCEYLEKVIPSTSVTSTHQSPFEDKLTKIIQQRRKYEEQRANMSGSESSSFFDYSKHMPITSARRLSSVSDASGSTVIVSTIHESVMSENGNQMLVPVIGKPTDSTPSRGALKSKLSSRPPSTLSSRTPTRPPSTLSSRTPTSSRFSSSPYQPSSATSTASKTPLPVSNRPASSQVRTPGRIPPKPSLKNRTMSAPSQLKSSLVRKEAKEVKPERKGASASTPKSVEPQKTHRIPIECVVRIQRWWRSTLRRRKTWMFQMEVRSRLEAKRLNFLENDVEALKEENRRLTKINEENTAVLADLVLEFHNLRNDLSNEIRQLREDKAKEVQELKSKIGSLEEKLMKIGTPKPTSLRFLRQDGKTVLVWDNVLTSLDEQIAHYNIYTNRQLCGSAKAVNRRIILTDTQPGDRIRIEAVYKSGQTAMSETLVCSSRPSKENIPGCK